VTTKDWPGVPAPVQADDLAALTAGLRPLADERRATVELSSCNGVPRLEGTAPVWQDVVDLGHKLSELWYAQAGRGKEVVVDLTAAAAASAATPAPGYRTTPPIPEIPRQSDIVVVGGGISGLVTGLKLAVIGNRVTVLDGGASWGSRTTAMNNGMVHSGFDPEPGTKKAHFNVLGNIYWDRLADDLQVTCRRAGSITVALDDAADGRVEEYYQRALANGVPRVEVLSGDAIRAAEPRLSKEVRRAILTPTTGYVEPVDVCRAAARQLRAAGGQAILGVTATGVTVENGRVTGVTTNAGLITCNVLINAAGIHADVLAETAGARAFTLHPRRGTLIIVEDDHANPYLYGCGPIPSRYTKGGGVTLRPSGTLSLGPSAVEQPDRDHIAPDEAEIDHILSQTYLIYPNLDTHALVSVGAQVRASSYGEDFVIGPAPGVIGFYNVAAMQSPGIASIPAVANHVAHDLLDYGLITTNKQRFTDLWRNP
jgi:glycerol-3-phosphate dehydrogenase